MTMKVLCSPAYGALKYIMRGWQEVFNEIGYEWHWWPQNKPSFDVFDEIEPNIVLLTNETCTRATMKCLQERPDVLVACKVGNWGYMDEDLANFHEKLGIPKEQYPVAIASDDEKKWLAKLHNTIGKPDFVYNLYHPNRLNGTMECWEDVCSVRGIMPAACLTHNKIVPQDPSLRCEIGFVGGYWPYKAINLDKYLIPLCYPVGKYNIKIFGNADWPVPQWLGGAKDATTNALASSAVINPNVSEPHANEFGFEVNERVFKLSACGAFCISDKIASLEEDIFFEHQMVVADDATHFKDLVHMFLQNHDLCIRHAGSCFEHVIENHTYYHRVAEVLRGLRLRDAADKCMELHEEKKQEIYDGLDTQPTE